MNDVPALQRREGRPTATLVFMFVLFLVPMGTCGTMGGLKLSSARAPVVPLPNATALSTTKVGTYVDVRVHAEPLKKLDLGWTAYAIDGVPDVVLFSQRPSPSGELTGQLCDEHSSLLCELPTKVVDLDGRRVLVDDREPHDRLWEAAIGFGIAGGLLLLYLLVAAFLLRAGAKPGVPVHTETVPLPHGAAALRAAIARACGPFFRLAEDTPERIVLLLGKTVAQTRLMGARSPETIPLRLDLVLQTGEAYRGASALVTVRELIPTPLNLPTPFGGVRQQAINRAIEWARALGR